LHRRLGRTGHNDEFTVLAATLDDLFSRLEASFESQRRFVANASHELRTPLTAERTLLQVALADPSADAESLRAACREVLALGEAQERLINALLTLASGEQGLEQRVPFDLATIARTVLVGRSAGRIEVQTSLEPAQSSGDPSLVESLVANLVDNALRHNVTGGKVTVSTWMGGDGRACLRVTNTGPVVAPQDVGRLFEPFQRLGAQRLRHTDGHGLGLAIVRAIATAHGASVHAAGRPEGGLDIEVVFG
jgi:signal transduction histidine kinase